MQEPVSLRILRGEAFSEQMNAVSNPHCTCYGLIRAQVIHGPPNSSEIFPCLPQSSRC
jgi:hypothetical protein